eukprot:gene14252-15739_t
MTEFAWLAPKPHKNIGAGSLHNIAPDQSLSFVLSRPGSAISLVGENDENNFSYSQQSKTNLAKETGWKSNNAATMPAPKGAWGQSGSVRKSARQRPGNGRGNGPRSRPGSARNDLEIDVMMSLQSPSSTKLTPAGRPSSSRLASAKSNDAIAVYKHIKHQQHDIDKSKLQIETSQLGTRSGNGNDIHPSSASSYTLLPIYVEGADSVNRTLEDEINQLQGKYFGQRNHDNGAVSVANAEFISLTGDKAMHERPRSGHGRQSPNNDLEGYHNRLDSRSSKHSSRGSSAHSTSSQKHASSKQGSGLRDSVSNKDGIYSGNRQCPVKSAGRLALSLFILDPSTVIVEPAFLLQEMSSLAVGYDNDNDLPTIVIDNNNSNNMNNNVDRMGEEPDSKIVKTKKESIGDARKRKLLMKIKHAAAFNQLFDKTREESLRSALDMDQCYNIEDLNKAKAEEKTEEDRNKQVNDIRETLPTGVPLKSARELKESKSKIHTISNVSDAGRHMLSPESLALMRSTIDAKQRSSYGEQPWLLGRLALSKQTCRFELPMDMRILKSITPMEYLMKYCIISRRRKTLYKNVFQRIDKDRDGWLSDEELVKALKEIHVNYIDQMEIDTLRQMLKLDGSAKNNKYNIVMFSVISAFSERLVLYLRKLHRRKDHGLKKRLEVADFSNLRWKIEGINVNPDVKNLLEML